MSAALLPESVSSSRPHGGVQPAGDGARLVVDLDVDRVAREGGKRGPGRFVRLRAWRHEGPIGGVTGVYALGEEGDLAREPVQRREGAV
jgi:hypothetical protein